MFVGCGPVATGVAAAGVPFAANGTWAKCPDASVARTESQAVVMDAAVRPSGDAERLMVCGALNVALPEPSLRNRLIELEVPLATAMSNQTSSSNRPMAIARGLTPVAIGDETLVKPFQFPWPST